MRNLKARGVVTRPKVDFRGEDWARTRGGKGMMRLRAWSVGGMGC